MAPQPEMATDDRHPINFGTTPGMTDKVDHKSQGATAQANLLVAQHQVVQQATQAAMLAIPFIQADSDSDDNFDPIHTTVEDISNVKASARLSGDPTSAIRGPEESTKQEPQSVDEPCPVTNNDTREKGTSNSSSDASRMDISFPAVEQTANSSQPSLKRENVPIPMLDAETNETSSTNQDASEITVNKTEGTVKVSKMCLDGVIDELENRISVLEQVCARKKARVEHLSSAAFIQHRAPFQMWPQTAMVTPPGVMESPGGALGLGQPPGSHHGAVTSRSGTPFLSAIPGAKDMMPAMMVAAAAAGASAVPPPPPPPTGDSGERKQSRYWTSDEHQRFLAAIKTCGPKNYVQIAEMVGTRNAKQVRTHAQKFQKKLEREEAKRREDMQRHGGAAAASSVSAAAVAAVAAAAAAMHHGAAGHMTAESNGAAHGPYPHILLPYTQTVAHGAAPNAALFSAAGAAGGDGSSSTNDVSNEHQQDVDTAPSHEAVVAVAAEAAALGSRLYSSPVHARDVAADAKLGTGSHGTDAGSLAGAAPMAAEMAGGVEVGAMCGNQAKNKNGLSRNVVIPVAAADGSQEHTARAAGGALAQVGVENGAAGGASKTAAVGALDGRKVDARKLDVATTQVVSTPDADAIVRSATRSSAAAKP